MRKTKEQGITLIALVITIIILLILAGAVLTMVFNGGIIDKSQKAVDKTRVESFKEEATIAMIGRKIEKDGTLEETLNSSITGNKIVEKAENVDDVCYVTRNGDTITVYESGEVVEGKVSVWDGTTKAVPEIKKENDKFNWYIYTAEELKFLADYVNNARQLNEDLTSYLSARNYSASDVVMDENTTVYLMNNIDLGAREGEGATIEAKWETTSNEAKKWEPIGIDKDTKKMVAAFEGNNYIISGVYLNRNAKFNGIFGNSNSISNLTVKNSYIKGKNNCTGGIVGALRNGEINNCHNINTIVILEGEFYSAAGIAGQAGGNITNCTNTGNIYLNSTHTNTQAGGIVGNLLDGFYIQGSSNTGNLKSTGSGKAIGGIAGLAQKLIDCNNFGSIDTNTIWIGGIVGNFTPNGELKNCSNRGIVIGQDNIGGIAGASTQNSGIANSKIENCNNFGKVIGNGTNTSGIVGSAGKSTTITGCNNSGNVTGGNDVGGVVGYAYNSTTITGCNNSGNVTGQDFVGGIAGVAANTVTKCSNTGNVIGNGTNGTGGIVGDSVTGQGQDISLCYNSGEVRGNGQVGGISGYLGSVNANPTGKEYKCYNKGKVINTGTTGIAGGVVGHMAQDANVTNCYYLNTIGVDRGVYSIGSGGDIDLQNQGVTAVSDDLTYEQFLTWIETK